MQDDILNTLHDEDLKSKCKEIAEQNGWSVDLPYVAVKAGAEQAVPILTNAIAGAGQMNARKRNSAEIARLQEELGKANTSANPLDMTRRISLKNRIAQLQRSV